MEKSVWKRSMILATSMLALAACGQAKSDEKPSSAPASATLVSRYTGGDYHTATYSFRFGGQGEAVPASNNWEILFEGSAQQDDYFQINTVVSDNSFIYDLGERRCSDIKSAYPGDRKRRPLVWLGYSDADPSEREPSKILPVRVGHCYLTYNNDEDGRVVALFHVKSHEEDKKVEIDEIEVLDVMTR